jgi:hypothetical protein
MEWKEFARKQGSKVTASVNKKPIKESVWFYGSENGGKKV